MSNIYDSMELKDTSRSVRIVYREKLEYPKKRVHCHIARCVASEQVSNMSTIGYYCKWVCKHKHKCWFGKLTFLSDINTGSPWIRIPYVTVTGGVVGEKDTDSGQGGSAWRRA